MRNLEIKLECGEVSEYSYVYKAVKKVVELSVSRLFAFQLRPQLKVSISRTMKKSRE